MQTLPKAINDQVHLTRTKDANRNSNTKILWTQQAISYLIVLFGLGYLLLIPAGKIQESRRFGPVDAGILVTIILANSGIIAKVTKFSIGKDGIEATIAELGERVNEIKSEHKQTDKKLNEEVNKIKDEHKLEAANNLKLLREIDLHLSGTISKRSDVQELKKLLENASPIFLEYVYQKAKELRHRISADKRAAREKNEPYNEKGQIERTREIFEALIEVQADLGDKRHRFYAQLGYAFKDQAEPNWQAAEKNLDDAIKLWEKDNSKNSELPSYYCFNWIICIIELAKKDGFKAECELQRQELITARMRALSNCPELFESLQSREYKNAFESWVKAQSFWFPSQNMSGELSPCRTCLAVPM